MRSNNGPVPRRISSTCAACWACLLILADLPPAIRARAVAIAQAAKRLADLRNAWLFPPEWTERVPEVVPLGKDRSPYPDRIVARAGFEWDLAKRTLTHLYNQRPAWLAQAQATPDLRDRLPDLALAIGLRNRLNHGCDKLDHTIILETVQRDLPGLIDRLRIELQPFPID